MPLNGELNDLSLSELIEFFCNQRKTGRLEVTYLNGSIELYLQSGALVHAQIGMLRGVDAVYYALTQPNASFKFSPQLEGSEQTINQPWSSVVLEGLRRMDEGIPPPLAFSDETADENMKGIEQPVATPAPIDRVTVAAQQAEKLETHSVKELVAVAQSAETVAVPEKREAVARKPAAQRAVKDEKPGPQPVIDRPEPAPAVVKPKRLPASSPLFAEVEPARRHSPGKLVAIAVAVVLLIAGVAIPWRWYAHITAAEKGISEAVPPVVSSNENVAPDSTNDSAAVAQDTNTLTSPSPVNSENRHLEQRRADNLRAKTSAAETPLTSSTTPPPASDPNQRTKPQSSPSTGAKKVTVQVTYDENGRVTQASGGDANALRIARQKRFPAGKPGSATVTIPIN